MWFESVLVFILFKFKNHPNISGIRVVHTEEDNLSLQRNHVEKLVLFVLIWFQTSFVVFLWLQYLLVIRFQLKYNTFFLLFISEDHNVDQKHSFWFKILHSNSIFVKVVH